jgi:hypothetical protein
MLRKKPRRDPVTPEMAIAILARDGGCLAPRLGGSSMDCWGRNRIEHVKREPRMGRRGDLLGTLCQGHTEDGTRAGYCWATDAKNREAMRRYLIDLEDSCSHVEPVHGCVACMRRADPLTLEDVAS